jgi:hypothetical protein
MMLENNLRFSRWEDEEEEEGEETKVGTSTFSKGRSNRSEPNDQIVKSPLKKPKKNVKICPLFTKCLLLQKHELQI